MEEGNEKEKKVLKIYACVKMKNKKILLLFSTISFQPFLKHQMIQALLVVMTLLTMAKRSLVHEM